jgi:predicted nucleic acid-binding protein
MIIIDTSVWIDIFRIKGTTRTESVLEFEEIVTCLPVIQEVLQGFRGERTDRTAQDAMTALPISNLRWRNLSSSRLPVSAARPAARA